MPAVHPRFEVVFGANGGIFMRAEHKPLELVKLLGFSLTNPESERRRLAGGSKVYRLISVDQSQHWCLHAGMAPEAADCIGVDINFSPSINLLPLCRLKHSVYDPEDITTA
jgi:Putative glycolipid-binding